MSNTKLHESHNKARKGHALLISEGVGSSGTYSAELLQRDGATAFPANTHLFINHIGQEEAWERNGSRDTRDLIGVTTEAATWSEDDRGLTAPIEIFPHARDFVESVWEHVGLSVEASGVVSEDGVVEALVYSPMNAVALVPVAGRGGKVQGLYEGYQEKYGSIITDESPNGKEDPGMTPEEIKSLAEALAEAIQPSLTALQEAIKPAEPVEDEDEGVDVATVTEALIESGLPAKARAKVLEAVKGGADLTESITAEKDYITDVLSESNVDESAGFVRETGRVTESFVVSGWSR